MPSSSKPRQIPFDLPNRAARGRDDLVVSPANRAVVDLIDRWPDWPAPILVVVGPRGSGKSHLAESWKEASGAAALSAASLGAARFDGDVPPLLVDDADAAELDEGGMFHLLNAARGAGRHVLLTASRPPARWNTRLADLRSRLRTAVTIDLEMPDEMLLAGVIAKLFADRQTVVEPAVVQFIAKRIERSLGRAADVVELLDKAAMEAKTRITRPLAAAVLDAAGGENEPAAG